MEALATLLPLILSTVEQFLPQIAGNSPAIASVVKLVVAATPSVISEYTDLKPILSRVIGALKGDAATTPEDLEALIAAEAQLDADFDEAAAAAIAEDDAADAADASASKK